MPKIITTNFFINQRPATEDIFSALVYQYVSHNYPFMRGLYFHVANERSDEKERMKAAAMGVVPGVLDFCFLPNRQHGTPLFFLELKLPGNKHSRSQLDFMARLSLHGIGNGWANSPEQITRILCSFLGSPEF